MRCIISLQHPKTQRILNQLVEVLATPIWLFRYRSMRCCREGYLVVSSTDDFEIWLIM
jgi:lambda repressor-like predicted transcriptional regulator